MFGLMRAKRCGLTTEQRNERRLHYCGTCKTLGSLYGQQTRSLLNHDTVFLAEILTALSEKPNFGRALQSYNCLAKPKSAEEMPLALKIAATANVVLAEFKIGDRIEDSKSKSWRVVGRFFDKSFRVAEKQLKAWDFPLAELKDLPRLQAEREAGQFVETGETVLFYLAEPTARATELFFRHGARLIGRCDLQDKMTALGAAFGEIVYLLDAFEDYENDARRNEFNAIRAAFDIKEAKLPAAIRREIETLLRHKENEIAEILHQLPLAAEKAKLFALRLNENLSRNFRKSLPLARSCSPKNPKTARERFAAAIGRSRELSANSAWWQLPFAFAAVLVVAFLAPTQARETKNWRECYELGFNLMFLGAAFGAVLALPKTIFLENPEELLTKEGRKKKARRAAASGGVSENNSGWCDGCECCCDCSDCCNGDCCCSCDGCCCDCSDCCNCSCD